MTREPQNAVAGPSKARPKHSKKNGKRPPPKSHKMRKLTEKQKIDNLDKAAMEFEPPEDLSLFADLPISENTKKGLKKASFLQMTDIQRQSIPVSLKGKDVLAAARTGSGKTLAFLIPVLEILHRRRWGQTDGLGALIISPTRELAVQIFEVLRSIGGYHAFSAGLVIGGKDLKGEADRLSRMNILVATPGRLLQHMDQTVGFDADNLQLLVLDEADRILDMGFQRTLTALLGHLPKSRQTLLFSATQTQTISDLARLSLNSPSHIGLPGTDATSSTSSPGSLMPQNLEQHYLVVPLPRKLDLLWSFIKTHLQSKLIVFLSSCKQVRFVFETFCKMHPGVPLLHLHGKQKQTARLTVYQKFIAMSHAVLFATDIAARGLDFPSVDWVVQLDAPEDAETYIHRVGRTARYESKGKALLFLLPSEEEGMKAALEKKGLKVSKIKNRESKMQSVQNQLQSLCFQDPEIKYLGQRAFVSYLRSIYVHKDKSIFKLEDLPVDAYAEALGLPGTPKIKFLRKEVAKAKKNAPRAPDLETYSDEEEDDDAESDDGSQHSSSDEDGQASSLTKAKPTVRTKYDRMFERKNQNVLSAHYSKLIEDSGKNGGAAGEEDDCDLFTLKRADHDLSDTDAHGGIATKHDPKEDLSKRKQKLGRAKKLIATGGLSHKLVFDDEGNPHELYELADADEFYSGKGGLEGVREEGKMYAMEENKKMRQADVVDKMEAREKKREKKRKRKEKEAALLANRSGGTAMLAVPSEDEDDGYVSPEFDLPPSSDEDDDDDDDDRARPPTKKARTTYTPSSPSTFKTKGGSKPSQATNSLEEDEELALRLLGRA